MLQMDPQLFRTSVLLNYSLLKIPVADGVRRVTHDDRERTLSEFTGMNHDDLFNFREGENQDILRFGNTSEFKQPAHVFSQF